MFEDIFARMFIIGIVTFMLFCGYADYKQSTENAKQKVSELFANPKNVSSEKIRNIIDLIKI